LIGLAWAAVTPELDLAAVLDGSAAALDVQITIDVYFALLCAGFGVLVGLLAFFRWADAGWPVPAGIAVGGLGGSVVAGSLGHRLRSSDVLDRLPPDVNQVIVDLVDFRLRSYGLYLVFPVVALVVLAIAIWAASVRGDVEHDVPADSSDHPPTDHPPTDHPPSGGRGA
nr:hypothetical protein [Micromonospora sp. DSM 115978]